MPPASTADTHAARQHAQARRYLTFHTAQHGHHNPHQSISCTTSVWITVTGWKARRLVGTSQIHQAKQTARNEGLPSHAVSSGPTTVAVHRNRSSSQGDALQPCGEIQTARRPAQNMRYSDRSLRTDGGSVASDRRSDRRRRMAR